MEGLRGSLVFIAENLVSAAQDLTLTARHPNPNRGHPAAARVVQAAQSHPAHSFVRRVARWLADNLDAPQME